jgi:hypothetical protein
MDHCLCSVLFCLLQIVVNAVDDRPLGDYQVIKLLVYRRQFGYGAYQLADLALVLILLLILQHFPLPFHGLALLGRQLDHAVHRPFIGPYPSEVLLFLVSQLATGLLDLRSKGGLDALQN